jgi:uncharacterized protein (TIGR00661 family)
MRIVYGVFGYGRGHTTRALAVLPWLEARHDVHLFAGGMAHEMLSAERTVTRVPCLSYRYINGKMDVRATLERNAAQVIDVLTGGPQLQAVVEAMRALQPDAAICDVDPFSHRAAAILGIPRISFDHYGILAHCRPPIPLSDRLRHARDVLAYRVLTGNPQRIVVSSFYDAPPRRKDVLCVGPLLREAVHRVRPSRGEHLLAYFNQPALFSSRVEAVLAAVGVPVLVYGTDRRGSAGNLEFRAPADKQFLDELARCRAVVGTAGNQLVGEALHFGKPILVMPESSVEQRVNAAAIARLGIGMQRCHHRLSLADLREFLDREQQYRDRTRWHVRDGRAEAVAAIEAFLSDLVRPTTRPTTRPAAAIARTA